MKTLMVGGGCFWCIEAVFLQIEGVKKVSSGYSGGTVPGTPTYREVSSGKTGHAEVVQVYYNPEVVSYKDLLYLFMKSHDPTIGNPKPLDFGSQYRSVIFYHNNTQKQVATAVLKELQPHFTMPITTKIVSASLFFPAEKYHQNYYNRNREASYCKTIIEPKLAKLKEMYRIKLKVSS